jgi:hypothetical protein
MTSIKQELDQMLTRCLSLHGYVEKEVELADGKREVQKIGRTEAVKEFIKTLAGDINSKEAMQEAAEKIKAAWADKTGSLQQALNATRVEAVGNFIASESTFKSAFFITITLGPAEEPWYTNETKNEMRVGSIGQDGSPERVRVVLPNYRTAVGLYMVTSDIVRYKTLDIYRGDVSETARKTLDIARDIRFKVDRTHYDLLNLTVANGGCFGAFATENANANKARRIYLAHSGIVTANLPTTNAIVNGTTAGTGGTRFTCQYYDPPFKADGTTESDYTGLRPAVLLAIADYASSWGDVLPDAGGQLVPTGDIIVPSCDIINFALLLQPDYNTVSTELQNQVASQGYFGCSYFGKNWRFIPDLTIATGTCYPRFNYLPGISYEKPNMSREFVVTNERENWEERSQQQAYGCVIPSQWRPRAVKITYAA